MASSFICVECGTIYPLPTASYTCNNPACAGYAVIGMLIPNKGNYQPKEIKKITFPATTAIVTGQKLPGVSTISIPTKRKANYKKPLIIGSFVVVALIVGWFANDLLGKKAKETNAADQNVQTSPVLTDPAQTDQQTKVIDLITPGGMHYQLYPGTDTQNIREGMFVKISMTQMVHDSILFSTDGNLSQYIPVFSANQPYSIPEIWIGLHAGDSVVATQLVDTFINRSPGNVPPGFKKGDIVTSRIKILAVMNEAESDTDKRIEESALLQKEIKFIEHYLAERHIIATKTASGALIEVTEPGTGEFIGAGKNVNVYYTSSSFDGKIFSSNTDSSFNNQGPLLFKTGSGQMIKGFDEAVQLMRYGSSARVYIPAMLAYGPDAYKGNSTTPYGNIIFDIRIVDAKEEGQ